jgi:TonB family protein
VFSELISNRRRRFTTSQSVSAALHVLVLLAIAHRAKPIFVMPSDVALGTPGSLGTITYLAPTGAERNQKPLERPKPALHATSAPKTVLPEPPAARDKETGSETAKFDDTARGGSPYGSRIPGAPLTGHEIIPALPQVFPDPAVSRADLPPGVEGDVIVEVTIDERGNVVELKLIHGIGYGIEDRVLATLRQWRFRPASKDGMTIASQHIVTFHYPS